MPIKASPKAVVASASGVYVWMDGSYQSIGLPGYNLGLTRLDGAGIANIGQLHSYDPDATGYGIAGGFGYMLPAGILPWAFGSNARIEIGGSYVDADTTDSRGVVTGVGTPFLQQMLNGTRAYSFTPAAGQPITSSLSSDYSAWLIDLKIAGDHRFGQTTLTPSFGVFGGQARTRQALSEVAVAGGTPLSDYTANTSLRWTDWGAKLGLNGKTDVTPWLVIGLGGSIGVAYRDASLSGNDTHVGFNGLTFDTTTSSVAASAHSAVFLANGEASIAIKPVSNVVIRAFAGVNYDSDMPGVRAPSFSSAPGGILQSPTAAGIKFEDATSYYAGGGLTVKFAP